MLTINNRGIDRYNAFLPSLTKFGVFPQTYYIADGQGLAAVLYYTVDERELVLLGLDRFREIEGLDCCDALCRAAMSCALNAGAEKAVFNDKRIRADFALADIAEQSLEKVFEIKTCGGN